MMMRMIVSAGVPALTDGQREADEDNPLGYFELEAVKTTKSNPEWLESAKGKVVKLVHILLPDLPPVHTYRIVMMHRNLDEVIASQQKMLVRSGKTGAELAPAVLKSIYTAQLESVRRWITAHPNCQCLDVHYDRVIADPAGESARVAAFLDIPQAVAAMAGAVERSLYRNRS